MSHKPTPEELLAQFDDLQDDGSPAPPPKQPPARASKHAPPKPAADDQDPLAELESLAAARPSSRPGTPKVAAGAAARNRSPRRTGIVTPSSTGSARTSEDRPHVPRKSSESARTFHQSFTPSTEDVPEDAAPRPKPQPQQQQSTAGTAASGGGGWWGGIFATATAAVKQAESVVKEIQKNEEAQRWAEQVKGNVGALRGFGGELRNRALPTFTNILHTLAPPISQHERLQIHITHDLVDYPSLDPMIYETFSRVMAQVEGGSLMVIQRGSESSQRRSSNAGYTGASASGWNDGPWWRQNNKRDLSQVKGLTEGSKLVRVSAESYANEFYAPRGGLEEAAKQATEILSESNPVRSSDIFLAIQAIGYTAPSDLFAGGAEETKEGVTEPNEEDELLVFAIYLHDPVHSISFKTVTQSFPQKWADWLNAYAGPDAQEGQQPEAIQEIIQSGGVDPREWVAEWMEEILSLGVGVVAQRYVARRMGVGEGGLGRGKAREEILESNGGEAARAGIF